MREFTTADGLSSNWVRRLAQDGEGRLFILTDKSLDRYTGAAPPGRHVHRPAGCGPGQTSTRTSSRGLRPMSGTRASAAG